MRRNYQKGVFPINKLWAVTLTPKAEGIVRVRGCSTADIIVVPSFSCEYNEGALIFKNEGRQIKAVFAPGQWVMAELEEEKE
jgi:hypothetical protein